ncbi:hypothetical protein [Methylobacillus flagellatus]|uniref:hypothetical protein n=1 Tax=Methylobacillus flagellatus TaxID=405 RepID=UPI0010F8E365|nr:hypothetical protein [Methylobacillus flagellatus]
MVKDAITSIKVALEDRVTSPLFGVFLGSWCVVNYKLVLILTSFDLGALQKIEEVPKLYPSGWTSSAWYLFLLPMLYALAIIFAYPYPSKIIFKYWYKKKVELNNSGLAIEEKRLMAEDTYVKVKSELLKQSESQSEIFDIYERNIRKLKATIEENNSQIKSLHSNNSVLEENLLSKDGLLNKANNHIVQLTQENNSLNNKYQIDIDNLKSEDAHKKLQLDRLAATNSENEILSRQLEFITMFTDDFSRDFNSQLLELLRNRAINLEVHAKLTSLLEAYRAKAKI